MERQRLPYAVLALGCAGLLGFGYYLQYVQGLEPCPLCLIQRAAFYGVGLTALLAAAHGPLGFGRRVYGALVALFALGGAGVAGRQVYLQHLPPELVPECGPGLEFMLKAFPLQQVLQEVFQGSGECAETAWTFLGLSIAEWSLLCFAGIALAALVHILRPGMRFGPASPAPAR